MISLFLQLKCICAFIQHGIGLILTNYAENNINYPTFPVSLAEIDIFNSPNVTTQLPIFLLSISLICSLTNQSVFDNAETESIMSRWNLKLNCK